jgi:hypothetical protein
MFYQQIEKWPIEAIAGRVIGLSFGAEAAEQKAEHEIYAVTRSGFNYEHEPSSLDNLRLAGVLCESR